VGRLRRVAGIAPDYLRTAWWGLVEAPAAPRPLRVVQAVILDARGVLLSVRRDLRGWELPGGNPAPGEDEPEALAREVREETGLEVRVERLAGEYHRSGFLPHVARVFRCAAVGGILTPSDETPRLGWFDPESPPRTLFPWYRGPLRDALGPAGPPVVRHEHQGLAAVWAGLRIDLAMRWSDDAAV